MVTVVGTKSRLVRIAGGVVVSTALLTGCAQPPLGPLVRVAPAPGKPFGQFASEDGFCRNYASSQVAGQAEVANQRALGGAAISTVLGAGLGAAIGGGRGAAVGAASGAGLGAGLGAGYSGGTQGGIQYQYDNAYAQCMYSYGNQVPGFAPAVVSYQPPQAYAPPPAYPVADPLVRSIQGELDRLGYLRVRPDGIAGPATVSAIQSFQVARNLPPDGAPSRYLLDALRQTPTGY